MEIRERLYAVRKSKKLNQEEFGKRIGVTRSAVCNYENGTRPIGEQVILAVCREFRVSEMWMRYEEGKMDEPEKDGVIDQLITEYNCSKFEGDFLKAYFQMTEVERSNFVSCMYRLFAPLMKGMKGANPFADYFSVTYGVDSPEALKAAAALAADADNVPPPTTANPELDIETEVASYREELELQKEAADASSASDGQGVG